MNRSSQDEKQPLTHRFQEADWRLFLIVVVALLGGRVLYCGLANPSFQSCMQSGMPKVLGMVLSTAALLFGIWAGPRIGQRLGLEWLGG